MSSCPQGSEFTAGACCLPVMFCQCKALLSFTPHLYLAQARLGRVTEFTLKKKISENKRVEPLLLLPLFLEIHKSSPVLGGGEGAQGPLLPPQDAHQQGLDCSQSGRCPLSSCCTTPKCKNRPPMPSKWKHLKGTKGSALGTCTRDSRATGRKRAAAML